MKNLIVLQDSINILAAVEQQPGVAEYTVCSFTIDCGTETVYILTSNGYVLCYCMTVQWKLIHDPWCVNMDEDDDASWFYIAQVSETNCVSCIAHSGAIVCITEDEVLDQVGVVDGGIAAAKWSPDERFLIIVTNNNSVMCMTSSWDVLHEINIQVCFLCRLII